MKKKDEKISYAWWSPCIIYCSPFQLLSSYFLIPLKRMWKKMYTDGYKDPLSKQKRKIKITFPNQSCQFHLCLIFRRNNIIWYLSHQPSEILSLSQIRNFLFLLSSLIPYYIDNFLRTLFFPTGCIFFS